MEKLGYDKALEAKLFTPNPDDCILRSKSRTTLLGLSGEYNP